MEIEVKVTSVDYDCQTWLGFEVKDKDGNWVGIFSPEVEGSYQKAIEEFFVWDNYDWVSPEIYKYYPDDIYKVPID